MGLEHCWRRRRQGSEKSHDTQVLVISRGRGRGGWEGGDGGVLMNASQRANSHFSQHQQQQQQPNTFVHRQRFQEFLSGLGLLRGRLPTCQRACKERASPRFSVMDGGLEGRRWRWRNGMMELHMFHLWRQRSHRRSIRAGKRSGRLPTAGSGRSCNQPCQLPFL